MKNQEIQNVTIAEVTQEEVFKFNQMMEDQLKEMVKKTEGKDNTYDNEETMMVGDVHNQFQIKKGSMVQIVDGGDWNNNTGFIAFISEGIAKIFSPAKQEHGLYTLGIWNAHNVRPYSYD